MASGPLLYRAFPIIVAKSLAVSSNQLPALSERRDCLSVGGGSCQLKLRPRYVEYEGRGSVDLRLSNLDPCETFSTAQVIQASLSGAVLG